MSNIINLHGKAFPSVLPTPSDPAEVVHSLRALWVARVLNTDAFFLGSQIAALAQASGTREVNITHATASHVIVRAHGSIFTGPVSEDRTAFVDALQALHFSARILNHYDANRLDDPDVADRHFTRNPDIGADSLWSKTTPIFFRLPALSKKDYGEGITELFNLNLARCNGSMNLKLQG